MIWFFLFIFVVIVGLGALVWVGLRDRRYLKKATREALGDELKYEVETERKEFLKRRSLFGQALEKAGKKFRRGADRG